MRTRTPLWSSRLRAPSPATACSTGGPRARRSNWSTRLPDPTARPFPRADWSPTTSGLSRRGAICDSPGPDSRRCGRGTCCGRGCFAHAGRLDCGHPAAGAGAAVGAGVRRVGTARPDGLGGRDGVPVPAADAARQRRHRDPQVPDHAGLQRQAQGHRHLGGRPQRRPARHQRPAAAGPCDGDVPVQGLGPRLGFAAQVRHDRRGRAAQLDLGTATRSGLYSPGHIRIKP